MADLTPARKLEVLRRFLRCLKSRFTMVRSDDPLDGFRDIVTGEMVYVYYDCYGDRWLAQNRWGCRVKTLEEG